jgi:hypothetical protein
VSWSTTDIREASTITITLYGEINAVSTFFVGTSFDLVTTTPPCSATPETITLEAASTSSPYTYIVTQAAVSFVIADFIEDSYACTSADYSYSDSKTPATSDSDFITYDSGTRTIGWYIASITGITTQTFTFDLVGTLGSPNSPTITT